MTVTVFTNAELTAYRLLSSAGEISVTTENTEAVREAANKIILLAEQIKTERSVMAMQLIANN